MNYTYHTVNNLLLPYFYVLKCGCIITPLLCKDTKNNWNKQAFSEEI